MGDDKAVGCAGLRSIEKMAIWNVKLLAAFQTVPVDKPGM